MVGKAYGEQGQAAQGWGLGEALLGLHCSPCPSLFTERAPTLNFGD